MMVDAFPLWAEGRPGRDELDRGRVVAMSPESLGHLRAKTAVQRVLAVAIDRASMSCEASGDGVTVRIDAGAAYRPDALVRCGSSPPADDLAFADPVVVVELSSPFTGGHDRCGELIPSDENADAFSPSHAARAAARSRACQRSREMTAGIIGYFGVPSVHHYLIVDAERRVLVHHARRGEEIATRILHDGPLRLDPPGLDVGVEDLFGEPPEA